MTNASTEDIVFPKMSSRLAPRCSVKLTWPPHSQTLTRLTQPRKRQESNETVISRKKLSHSRPLRSKSRMRFSAFITGTCDVGSLRIGNFSRTFRSLQDQLVISYPLPPNDGGSPQIPDRETQTWKIAGQMSQTAS